jgi:RHS repeat-associated protein
MMRIKTLDSRLKEVSPFNLHGTVAVPCGTSVSSLNADNQRTQATLPDGSAWSYSYDTKSQLTGAVRGETNAMSYAYDGIGNRLTAEEDGAGTVCTANNLNQYTAINAEAPAYDADGNMTSWNGWNYTWNTENRLVAAEKGSIRFEADYDFMGRRFEKKIYENGVLTKHEKYAYDGYKLVAIFDALDGDALKTTFTWQPVDLDTPLAMTHNGETFYYVTDGNKNVIQLLRADKTAAAAYTYAPFGGVLEQQGALASVNPFRFSSEFHDDETGLVYYNYRYYNPVLGRWTKRDPVGEEGGINSYLILINNPVFLWDYLGLKLIYLGLRKEKDKADNEVTVLGQGMVQISGNDETVASVMEQTGLPFNYLSVLNPKMVLSFNESLTDGTCLNVVLNPFGDEKLLAQIAFGEATSGDFDDKRAVTTVIMNRIYFHNSYAMKYPKLTPMYASSIAGNLTKQQFNAVGGPKWRMGQNPKANIPSLGYAKEWNSSVLAAKLTLGGQLYQPIRNATIFHSDRANGAKRSPMAGQVATQYWDWTFEAQVGEHYYFSILEKPKSKIEQRK